MPRFLPPNRRQPFTPPPDLPFWERLVARLQFPVANYPLEDIDRMYYDEQRRPRRILQIGGGPSRFSDFEIVLNIEAFDQVDVVGDGHHLPFADNTFDGVMMIAVMEHVRDPRRVARETLRVLKPDGAVLSVQPWIHQYHAHPSDFHRFSFDTFDLVFDGFETVHKWINVGPHYTILKWGETYMEHALRAALPFGRTRIPRLARIVYWLLFFWIKYLDFWCLEDSELGKKLANNTLYMGRKREEKSEE